MKAACQRMECSITGMVFHHVFSMSLLQVHGGCECDIRVSVSWQQHKMVWQGKETRAVITTMIPTCDKATTAMKWQWLQRLLHVTHTVLALKRKVKYIFIPFSWKQTNRKSIPSWQRACKYKNADLYSSDHPTFVSLPNLSFSSLIFWVHVFLNFINVANCICYTANFLGNAKHALLKPCQWWKYYILLYIIY